MAVASPEATKVQDFGQMRLFEVADTGTPLDSQLALNNGQEPLYLADGRIAIDGTHCYVDEVDTHFTYIERKMLKAFAQNPDKLLSSEVLYDKIWGYDERNIEQVKLYVGYLRNKLGPELGDKHEGAIKTRRDFGYLALSSLSTRDPIDRSEACHSVADGRVEVITASKLLLVDNQVVYLTPREFALMEVLCRSRNVIIPPTDLAELAWFGHDGNVQENVKLYIGYIRKKLGDELGDGSNGIIRSVRGVGYCAVHSLENPNPRFRRANHCS